MYYGPIKNVASDNISSNCLLRPRPHVSGDFCIRKFFYADTPSVHTCPPYTLGVSGDFCIRSPEWKFLYTLCIRIRVDARIRIFLYTLTSHVLKPQVNKQESREFGAKIIAGSAFFVMCMLC